jgi:hypothetical protein
MALKMATATTYPVTLSVRRARKLCGDVMQVSQRHMGLP